MCDAQESRPVLATVVDEPRQRDAAEADAIDTRSREMKALRPARHAPSGSATFHGGIHRFRAGVDEEDAVEIARRKLRDACGELELLGCARRNGAQKSSPQLGADGAEISAPVSGVDAESPDDASMILSPRSFRNTPFRPDDHLRIALNSRFGERHPVFVERNAPTTCSWIVSSAWPIVLSFAGSAQCATRRPNGVC
jgi:hypothetical protein